MKAITFGVPLCWDGGGWMIKTLKGESLEFRDNKEGGNQRNG